MKRKRPTARRAEREISVLLKEMDRLRRYVAKLAKEDIPADLANFGAAAQAFLAHFDPFVQRRRQVAKLRWGLGGAADLRRAIATMERIGTPEALEDVAKGRAMLAEFESIVPEIKATLASLVAAQPVDTADLKRMLLAGRRPRKSRR